MDVQRAEARGLQEGGRQEQSVSGHHQRIRAQGANFLELGSALEVGGLAYRNTARGGQPLDGTRRRPQAAARRTVGLGENQRNFMARVEQARQRPLGELGRTGED